MFSGIIAKAEKATAWVGRYCDLDRAARWRNVALAVGMTGWAGRWILVAILATDLMGADSAAVKSLAAEAVQSDSVQKTALYAAAIIGCMAVKWAGWTYGGVGYVHHRARTRAAGIA